MSWKPVNTGLGSANAGGGGGGGANTTSSIASGSNLSKPAPLVPLKPPPPTHTANEPAKGFFDKLKDSVKQTKRQLQETFSDGKPIETDAAFQSALLEFGETEKALLQLKKHIDEYIRGIKAVSASHFNLATDLMFFYEKQSAHRSVAEEFLTVQTAFHSQHSQTLTEKATDEIANPIAQVLSELPAVKEYVEKRKVAMADLADARKQVAAQKAKPNQATVKGVMKLASQEESLTQHEQVFFDVNKTCMDYFEHYKARSKATIDLYFVSIYQLQAQFFTTGHSEVTERLANGMSTIAFSADTVAARENRGTISIPPAAFLNRELPTPKSEVEDEVSRGWTPYARELMEKHKKKMAAPAPPQPASSSAKVYYPNAPHAFRKSFAEMHYSFDPNPKGAAPSANRPPPPPPPSPAVNVRVAPTAASASGAAPASVSKPKQPASAHAHIAVATTPTLIPIPQKSAASPATATPAALASAATNVAVAVAQSGAAASFSPFPKVEASVSAPISSGPLPSSLGVLVPIAPKALPPATAAAAANYSGISPALAAATLAATAGSKSIMVGSSAGGSGGRQPPLRQASLNVGASAHVSVIPPPPPKPVTAPAVLAAAAASHLPPPPPLPPGRPNRAPTVLKNQVKKLAASSSPAPPPPPPTAAGAAVKVTVTPPPPPPTSAGAAAPPPASGLVVVDEGAGHFGSDLRNPSGTMIEHPEESWDAISISQGRNRASAAGAANSVAAAAAAAAAPVPQTYVTATFDYDAQRAIELSFHLGDRLWVVERDEESGWWQVMNDAYETGWIPSNYTDQTEKHAEPEGSSH